MSNKKTKYQEINAFFNLDNSDKTSQKNKIIIKGDSPEDINAKALEIQQKIYYVVNSTEVLIEGFRKHYNMKQQDYLLTSIMKVWSITLSYQVHWIYIWKNVHQ